MASQPDDEQRRMVVACFARTGLSVEQLWLRYFALGGDASQFELDAFLQGLIMLPRMQRDMIAHAVNERLNEVTGPRRVPYSTGIAEGAYPRGPLVALVDLLEGTHRAPPERLPAVISAAGRALDLDVFVYLADYEQRLLLPLPGDGAPDRTPLDLENSTAGLAYQHAGSVITEDVSGPRLWTTLLDGDERMGVLEVVPSDGTNLRDPILRDHCRWLATLSGHLVAATTRHGDGLETVRLRQRRGPAAELLWQNLPPLTAATDSVVVAGGLEPGYDLRGAAFDYALSESTAWLAIFDAGHDVAGASLIAAAVLAACRSARRAGLGLRGQEAAIDDTLATQFSRDTTVQGTLAELDLTDGSLRYLRAGQPASIVVRENLEQAILDSGGRAPFGMGRPARVATTRLRPGDLLALPTVGVADARSATGERFGLAECLHRNAGEVPSETTRRVLHALSSHCGGEFADDAGLLMAKWSGRP